MNALISETIRAGNAEFCDNVCIYCSIFRLGFKFDHDSVKHSLMSINMLEIEIFKKYNR